MLAISLTPGFLFLMFSYVALTVHLELKGKPLMMILDVVEVAKSHSGVNLAAAFIGVLKDFKIDHKVIVVLLRWFWALNNSQMLSVTCDNASCNNTMVAEINEQVEEFSEVNHIQCFMHIVNLVAKSLLKQFDAKKAGSDGNGDPNDAELTKLMEEFARDFEHEEWLTQQADTADEDEMDNIEGDIEPADVLMDEERANFKTNICPVTLMLAKVGLVPLKASINSWDNT
jgi:hypothetical protein